MKVLFSLLIDIELKEWIKDQAWKQKTSMSALISKACEEYLEKTSESDNIEK